MIVNLRSFSQKVRHNKKALRSFLTKLEKKPPRELHRMLDEVDRSVWAETDCLTCGNCCKKMTPTFTTNDLKRISAHFGMTPKAFKEKWLVFDKTGDWHNKTQPCQFLDLTDNKCSIYPIRPEDCAGFPHLTKRKALDYIHIHKQNIQYCPATYKMVEKMKQRMSEMKS